MYEPRGNPPEHVEVKIPRAVGRNRAVAPEAHLRHVFTRIPPSAARWLSARAAYLLD
ncbi:MULTISPECIES: hypothetical protein [unclassified Streptomyces]|uniref:hypothetical protein n=1 Tax=unclassified Streptomyces TaxID=2593676 RepID=UPI002E81D38F|nr:hypothetical protein [Streptomyces sp. NBC_00562]WUC22794.1 hypothetical protein OHA33_30185 [Streptomyces sp. NBC_00562]